MSYFRGAIAIALILMVGACVTTNPSSPAYRAELGWIAVEVEGTRIGQLYSQRLNRLLNRHQRSSTLYELDVVLTTSDSSDAVTMSASLGLYDQSVGEIVATKSISASATVGAVASLYGSEEAKRHARERLAGHLADKTYPYLLLHFSRSADARQE